MNFLNPIFTEKGECQDCYKCLRHCPVKAIRVESGVASVIPELCIACGQCVELCPSRAKRVRDDVPLAKQLLASGRPVFLSLAPSFITEFAGIEPARLIHALKRLGFAGVSETALGAQWVSSRAAEDAQAYPGRSFVSSACPTVVRYIQTYRPRESSLLTPLLSPLLAHCKLLRARFGPGIGIVFAGPCIAKKLEAGFRPDLLDVALTFEDLWRWFESEQIDLPGVVPGPDDQFVPERSAQGAWYPVDGGMIAGIKLCCPVNDDRFMAFSGIPAIARALDGLCDEDGGEQDGVFLELLACEGGCVNGPKAGCRRGTAVKRGQVLRYGRIADTAAPEPDLAANYVVPIPASAAWPESKIREMLQSIGKRNRADELNCGGCGYDSCRHFVFALIEGKAERSMCVTNMRKLALKKANALMQKMPAAVVIVDERLRVIECNGPFAALCHSGSKPVRMGSDAEAPFEGTELGELLPFANLFRSVLNTGQDILDRDLRYQNTILHATIFNIEKHQVVGAIFQDITEPAVHKAEVIRKAKEVIVRSLATTQEIARLLGENAAESEVTLNSIIESFTPDRPEEPKPDHDWRDLYRR